MSGGTQDTPVTGVLKSIQTPTYAGLDRREDFDTEDAELRAGAMKLSADAEKHLGRKPSVQEVMDFGLRRKGISDQSDAMRVAVATLFRENLDPTAETSSLAEMTSGSTEVAELTSEESLWLSSFKTNFDALPGLHPNIEFADVERSLRNDPVTMKKIMAFDANGHFMNVFGEEDGEYVFVSAFTDYNKVSLDHRNLCFDTEGERLSRKNGDNPTRNAVEIVNAMGAKLANGKYHSQLIGVASVNGFAWLETDEATRKAGLAFFGYNNGLDKYDANHCYDGGSFRATLRVKKS